DIAAAPLDRVIVERASDRGAHVASDGSAHQGEEVVVTGTRDRVDGRTPRALRVRAGRAVEQENEPDRMRDRIVVQPLVVLVMLLRSAGKRDGAIVQSDEVSD